MAILKASLIFVLLALYVTGSKANATNWVSLGNNVDGDTFYIDESNVRNIGGVLQVWTMVNFGTPKANGTRSQMTAFLLNCQTWEWAVRSGVDYSAPNGQGELLSSITARPHEIIYQPAIPSSVTDEILSLACTSTSLTN